METGKTSKYLKYAIGEIVLVVLGILIALSINNWNERKKLQVEEQKLINALIKEIESNIESINISINTNKKLEHGSSEFLKQASSNLDFDFDVSNIPQLFAYSSNKIENSILNEILGTDSRAIISNQNYIEQLRILKRSYDRSNKTQFYIDEYWNGQIAKLLNDLGLGVFMGGNNYFKDKKIDFEITNSFLSSLSLMNGYQQSLLMSREDLLEDLNNTLQFFKNVKEN